MRTSIQTAAANCQTPRHEEQGIRFLELFVDVPLSVVQERDPKGLYAKVAAGELKGFTGVDDPYEAPEHPEIVLPTDGMTVQQSVDVIMRALVKEGALVGGPTLPNGLPYPDGDEIGECMCIAIRSLFMKPYIQSPTLYSSFSGPACVP